MPQGAKFDKPIAMIGLQREGGVLVAEMPLALFLTAADALKAKYGDPR